MSLPKKYQHHIHEPARLDTWETQGVYHFSSQGDGAVYSIDTPPATVSGHLHLGHVYSYSHADFMARFWRMNGRRVYYPMGYDDNGLPTERLVEKTHRITANTVGRDAFIKKCLEVAETSAAEYRALWQRLGLSADWRYTYRTIDARSQRTAQWSFLDLLSKGLAYRKDAPAIWCPECQTAIAQAEVDDLDRKTDFYTLAFELPEGTHLPIATTRPELLPACVAVFVHPDDRRYQHLIGKTVLVPFACHQVPVLADKGADPEKGTGVVMCCTFGDQADVAWWHSHSLPLRVAIGSDGRFKEETGPLAGLTALQARARVLDDLEGSAKVLESVLIDQTIRVHERCSTAVEFIPNPQWFIRLLGHKEALLAAGDQLNWHPEHMYSRFRDWVNNLAWDWCISRQRNYGVPIPLWYCQACGEIKTPMIETLPVDPRTQTPEAPCDCGSTVFTPETDVMDTWMTSSMSPQIAGGWGTPKTRAAPGPSLSIPTNEAEHLLDQNLYQEVFPYTMRAQAHEIIRTWAFYTVAKAYFHFGALPWKDIFVSGWGIAGKGMGKISKSKGGGPRQPLDVIEQYSADAVRYWAASTAPGKDAIINEEKIRMGKRLTTKLWNVARFSEPFLVDKGNRKAEAQRTPADHWILSQLARLITRVTELFREYEYAAAKSEIEVFFWRVLSDNYLEMAKQRLYDPTADTHEGARETITTVLEAVLKLFAPILPFVTDEIYMTLFCATDERKSIHLAPWPTTDPAWDNPGAASFGETLVEIGTAVRRYKSEKNLPLSTPLTRLQLGSSDTAATRQLEAARADLQSLTRAENIEITAGSEFDPAYAQIEDLRVAIDLAGTTEPQ